MSRCGVRYETGTVNIPKRAKYAVYFWGYVIYNATKKAAETTFGKLSYYEQEEAQIERL